MGLTPFQHRRGMGTTYDERYRNRSGDVREIIEGRTLLDQFADMAAGHPDANALS
ncbi:MAG TPA: hypothetical protein VGR61_01180 [Candidatus Dormibacteraeota bacterium]|nr:hypothetical protein [Candidatus Dormibacteraeota bacterium]